MSERLSGKVKWFNPDKGFGFIVPDAGGNDVFVHINSLPAGVDELVEDQRVTFATVPGREGKGPKAVDLQLA